MTCIIFFTILLLIHQVVPRSLVPAEVKKEMLEKSGVVIRSELTEDSPQWLVQDTYCPEGYLRDFLGVCREVW